MSNIITRVLWTRQPQLPTRLDSSTYSAWEAWIPACRGQASNRAGYSATPSTRAAFGVGPAGPAFTFTGAEFTAAWTFSAEPSVTSECWLVVVGPTIAASATSGTILGGSNSIRWNAGGMKIRASSTDTASSAVAPSPGDAIFFVCKNADYRIYHRNVKTTAAGGLGWGGLTGMLQKTGDSASLVARLTNIIPDDAQIWRWLDNPWQLFAPITGRIWEPASAGGATAIDCAPGNASAAGTASTLSLDQTIACSVGNAVAAGTAATITTAQTIACTVGNAVAAGIAATLTTDQTIDASVGNAVAAGVSATIDIGGVVSIDCTVGNATAAGIAAAIDATDAVIESAANRGAGKSRSRKRRYTVEVNGEEYSVESAEEALAVLNKAKEAAQEAADLALTRAVKATKRPLRKVLADARKTMEAPHIVAPPAFEFLVDDIARQIDEIYSRTITAIEISARLAIQRRAEEEDDEDILLLL